VVGIFRSAMTGSIAVAVVILGVQVRPFLALRRVWNFHLF
jgi:hypothetical protein